MKLYTTMTDEIDPSLSQSLGEYEKRIVDELEKYKQMHAEEKKNIYDSDTEEVTNVDNANIMDSMEKIDSLTDDEIRNLFQKCYNTNKMKRELLRWELKYKKIEPRDLTLQEFIKEADFLIDRYQSKAGGSLLEDRRWILHDGKSEKYPLLENEIIFENSISAIDSYDVGTSKYIKYLVNILDKLSTQIRVSLKIIESREDSLVWVCIKCKMTSKLDEVKVSL